MSTKSMIVVEIVKGENAYQFLMPIGVPIGEAYDAAFQVLNEIIELSKQAVEKVKPQDQPDDVGATSDGDDTSVVEN